MGIIGRGEFLNSKTWEQQKKISSMKRSVSAKNIIKNAQLKKYPIYNVHSSKG